MTQPEIEKINAERLDGWRHKLTANHATPFLVIGVGHDEHGGEMHIIVPENVPLEMVRKIMLKAFFKLDNLE